MYSIVLALSSFIPVSSLLYPSSSLHALFFLPPPLSNIKESSWWRTLRACLMRWNKTVRPSVFLLVSVDVSTAGRRSFVVHRLHSSTGANKQPINKQVSLEHKSFQPLAHRVITPQCLGRPLQPLFVLYGRSVSARMTAPVSGNMSPLKACAVVPAVQEVILRK